jgi:hypothetical protein
MNTLLVPLGGYSTSLDKAYIDFRTVSLIV